MEKETHRKSMRISISSHVIISSHLGFLRSSPHVGFTADSASWFMLHSNPKGCRNSLELWTTLQEVTDRDIWRFEDKVVELISLFSNI